MACGEEIILSTPSGRLFGRLELPTDRSGRMDVALIWSGSGPTDRDGNSHLGVRARSLRLLAEGLAAAGIASLRTDKRGVGDSMGAAAAEEDMTFETYVEDAASWLERLRSDDRFARIVAIGHSEGAAVLLRAATGRADAVVCLAGAGRRLSLVLREQLARQTDAGRLPEALHDAALRYIEQLERGEKIERPDPRLSGLFRPSVQPFLISTFRFDPQAAARALAIPLLIVQGDADAQVTIADAQALHEAQPRSQLLVFRGVNHLLKLEPSDPGASLAARLDPSLPLADGLIGGIVAFIAGLTDAR